MHVHKILKVEGLLSLIGSTGLMVWWFAMPLFLPLAEAADHFQILVLDPQWTALNLLGLISVILLALGFPGFYVKGHNRHGPLGFTGLLLTCTGLILYACIQYYETLLWPAAARVDPGLLETAGVLVSGDAGVAAGLIVSGVFLAVGYILFGIHALRNSSYPRIPLWFLITGAPVFGLGVLFPLRTLGLLLFCAGTIWLAVHLRKE